MTTHKRVGDEVLQQVWEKAARAKASFVRSEGNLHATMCHYAADNSLDSDAFTERTKRMEEALKAAAPNTAQADAVRSSSSSVRSVVAAALDQKRTVVRDGKPVGKTRLEQEKKACINGHTAQAVMDADTNQLKSLASAGVGVTSDPSGEKRAAANSESDVVLNIQTNLANFLKTASDEIVQDLAFELMRCDPRLTAALELEVKEIRKAA